MVDDSAVNELMMWLAGGSAQTEASKYQPEVKDEWEGW